MNWVRWLQCAKASPETFAVSTRLDIYRARWHREGAITRSKYWPEAQGRPSLLCEPDRGTPPGEHLVRMAASDEAAGPALGGKWNSALEPANATEWRRRGARLLRLCCARVVEFSAE